MNRYLTTYFTLFLAVFMSTTAAAQNDFNHYIYHLDTGVLSPKNYDHVLPSVTANYLKVKVGDTWGVLEKNGVEIIPTTYNEITINTPKHPDYIIANADGKWGVLDSKNTVVIPFTYEHLSFINLADSVYFKAEKNGYIGLIDAEETIKLPFRYTFLKSSYTHQIFTLSTGQNLNEIDALKDPNAMKDVFNNGEIVFYNALFEEIFRVTPSDDINAIFELLTKARLMTDLIDSKGNFLVSPDLPVAEIDWLIAMMADPNYEFAKDSPYVHLNTHKKTLNTNTKSSLAQKQDDIEARYTFSVMGQPEGETPKPLTSVTNADGKEVLPSHTFYDISIETATVRPQSNKELRRFKSHFAAFENEEDPELYHIFYFRVTGEEKSIGMYDLEGNVVIHCNEKAFNISVHKDGIVVGRLGVPKLKNNSEESLRAQPIYALFDFKGKALTAFKYTQLANFAYDRAVAQDVYSVTAQDHFTNPNYGLINGNGKMMVPFEYSEIRSLYGTNLKNELFISSKLIPQQGKSDDVLLGLLDRNGKIVVPNQYSDIHVVENRYALLLEQLGDKRIRQSVYDLETQTMLAQFEPIYTVISLGNQLLRITTRKGETLLKN